jgi:hypothetical protein
LLLCRGQPLLIVSCGILVILLGRSYVDLEVRYVLLQGTVHGL